MYTLYHCPNTCSTAVKIALEVIGVAHQVEIVDIFQGEQFSEQFLALNPQGKVPVLVNSTQVLTQGEAILVHLSQKFPTANLMPSLATEEGASALKWLNFVASSIHGTFSKIFRAELIANEIEVVKANAEEVLVKQFDIINSRLQQSTFLVGEQPSLGDYYLAVVLGWSQVLSFDLLERYPELQRFKSSLQRAQPSSESLKKL